jgi:hypothetical protein
MHFYKQDIKQKRHLAREKRFPSPWPINIKACIKVPISWFWSLHISQD